MLVGAVEPTLTEALRTRCRIELAITTARVLVHIDLDRRDQHTVIAYTAGRMLLQTAQLREILAP